MVEHAGVTDAPDGRAPRRRPDYSANGDDEKMASMSFGVSIPVVLVLLHAVVLGACDRPRAHAVADPATSAIPPAVDSVHDADFDAIAARAEPTDDSALLGGVDLQDALSLAQVPPDQRAAPTTWAAARWRDDTRLIMARGVGAKGEPLLRVVVLALSRGGRPSSLRVRAQGAVALESLDCVPDEQMSFELDDHSYEVPGEAELLPVRVRCHVDFPAGENFREHLVLWLLHADELTPVMTAMVREDDVQRGPGDVMQSEGVLTIEPARGASPTSAVLRLKTSRGRLDGVGTPKVQFTKRQWIWQSGRFVELSPPRRATP